MKTCMFTGMFRNRGFDEAVRLAAEIGYQGVEVRLAPDHFTPEMTDAEIMRRADLIRSLGLGVASLYAFSGNFSTASDEECESNVEAFARQMEIARILGTDMVKIGCGGPNAFLAEEYHFMKSAFWLRRCADLARPAGIRLVIEIHNSSLAEDLDGADKLYELVGRDNLGFIHDAGNMYITGEDFGAESVRRLGARLFHVHVKDVARVSEEGLPGGFRDLTRRGRELFQLVPLGRGGADHRPLIRALKASGYTGYLSTEANLPINDIEMVRHEFAELSRMIGEA